MTSSIATIIKQEFRILARQKTFLLILIIFLLMALFSTYIGWSTKQTILGVYNETVARMIQNGVKQIPANPFLALPTLSILKNMTVYIFLIGSLLAVVVGHDAFMSERRSGTLKLTFSRPITKNTFLWGKIIGIALLLGLILFIAYIVSFFSARLVLGHFLQFKDVFLLLAFYFWSYIYLLIFAFVGLFFALSIKSQSVSLIMPILFWIIVSLVLPQMISALDPTALLNPANISADLPQSHFFLTVQSVFKPFSMADTYKLIGASILEKKGSMPNPISLIIYLALAIGGCLYAIKKFSVASDYLQE